MKQVNAKYGYRKQTQLSFDEAVARVTSTLANEGFGILATIDMAATLKAKLDVELDGRYTILGACNPGLAREGLASERELGLLLPCNVLVYEEGDHTVVSAMMPEVVLGIADNDALAPLGDQAGEALRRAVDNV